MVSPTDTRFSSTDLRGEKQVSKIGPPLAQYLRIDQYVPKYGDFVIWQRLFKTWYCIVNDYDQISDIVSLVADGTPRLMLTMTPDEMEKRTYLVRLDDIKYWKRGHFYALQDNDGKQVWYC